MDVNAFVSERDQALLSMDEQQIRAMYRKYNHKDLPQGELFWVVVHKARTAALSLPEAERLASERWLRLRGYHPLG